MRLTPLGKLVVAAIIIMVAWRLFAHSELAKGTQRAITRAEITPVDVMVFIAVAFVALLVFMDHARPPGSAPR